MLLSLTVLSVVVACREHEEDGLTVFAAASLHDAMAGLELAWAAERPDAPLTIATEASNVLAAQIGEGAGADVFISADRRRPRELAEAGLTGSQPVPFARNRVTIVVPAADGHVRQPADLAIPGTRLVAIGRGVPITGYADEALARLAATMDDPESFSQAVGANVVSREDNVRAALAKVALGEGDAAVVYRTDAASSEAVREIPFPAEVTVTAEYAAVAVSERKLATEFVEWLGSAAAVEVLQTAGFEAGAR